MTWSLALLFRPVLLLVLAACVFAPAVYAVRRFLPDGRLKKLLLLRIHDGQRYTLLADLKRS